MSPKHLILSPRLVFIWTLIATGLVVSNPVKADLKEEIIKACRDYQSGVDKSLTNGCKLYIDGFIDATLLTADAQIGAEKSTDTRVKPQSDFMKRAIRMRLIDNPEFGSSSSTAQFCIPENSNRAMIASKIAKSIDINLLNAQPLKRILFDNLRANFPC